MFAWNENQEKRQQDYERFRKLTEWGHSISEEVSTTESMYAINTDPFGRAYYAKPLGGSIRRDPITGREYEQEEWSVKEYMVDNKTQLVNKVSADLLVGKSPEITLGDEKKDGKLNEWLQDEVIKPNKFNTKLLEGATKVSSLGDLYFDVSMKDGKIKLKIVEPDYVDPVFRDGEIESYRYAWFIEESLTGNLKVDRAISRAKKKKKEISRLLRVKEYFKGKIEHSIFTVSENKIKGQVSLELTDPEMYKKAENKGDKTFVYKEATDSKDESFTIIEYTGIDEILLVYWPNYRLMKWFGQSDNQMIESLQNALNSRQTQLNDVLDKHSDPAMAGPAGFMDENGLLRMAGGGGRYFPTEGGDKAPEYLTWEGHIAEVHKEIERIYIAICDNTEVSPALMGMGKGGIESGRALMYRLIRSLAMKARKGIYLTEFIEELFRVVQKMRLFFIVGNDEPSEEMKEDWGDDLKKVNVTLKENLPIDVEAKVMIVRELFRDGLVSLETAIVILSKLVPEIEPEEAKAILKTKKEQEEKEWERFGVPVQEEEEEEFTEGGSKATVGGESEKMVTAKK